MSSAEEDSLSQSSSVGVPPLPRDPDQESEYSVSAVSMTSSSPTPALSHISSSPPSTPQSSRSFLAPSQFLHPLREHLGGASGAHTVAYRGKEYSADGAFRRKSAERHTVHEDAFAQRRSPKAQDKKWTEMFSSKRIKKKIGTVMGYDQVKVGVQVFHTRRIGGYKEIDHPRR